MCFVSIEDSTAYTADELKELLQIAPRYKVHELIVKRDATTPLSPLRSVFRTRQATRNLGT